MDEKQLKMKKITLLVLACMLPALSFAQLDYKWEAVRIDSTFDNGKDYTVTKIIEKYDSLVAPLQEIIGYAEDEYSGRYPESPLSNFAADALRECAINLSGGNVDVALTNFGGIRSSMPKGAVRVYDIYSIFPFNNDIVWFDVKGSDLRAIFERMAKSGRIQAWSNVELVIERGKIIRVNVGGAPLDDNRVYRMATINFLMEGGDGLALSKVARNQVSSGVYLRDAFVGYIKDKTAKGEKLKLATDGRVKIIE